MLRRTLLTASISAPLLSTVARSASNPVVLELFTSQGCSSCPPADALLGELSHEHGVIALAWHVDYWDALGWRDPYARREWTERQRKYAKALSGEVYTPALVVNGATMLVGSDRSAVRRAIDQASPPSVSVVLRGTPAGIDVEIAPTATPVTGQLITYDTEQTTQVGAGENMGHGLREYRVVREAVNLEGLKTRFSLTAIPPSRGAVLLLQDASSRIVGAADLLPS
jgi:hypothetical protein